MGAALPNYQKLYELGKLPKYARIFIPGLKMLDDLKRVLCDDCKLLIDDDGKIQEKKIDAGIPCSFQGCFFMAKNQTGFLRHSTIHQKVEVKE